MIIGGFQKLSLSDFPGKIAAIVFTRGCNFRCPYCHNPELVDPGAYSVPLEEAGIIRFLETRLKKLQGIVVTGGEPTIHPDLPGFLERLKEMGFSIKLDTNGSDPVMLETLLDRGLVDYCAMDVKASLPSYSRITRSCVDTEKILASIKLLKSRRIDHEFRTTHLEALLSPDELLAIGNMVKGSGSRFILQGFKPSKTLDARFMGHPPTSEDALRSLQASLIAEGIPCDIR